MPFVFREELRPLFKKITSSTVEVLYKGCFGAGVVLTESGLILTAHHVVDGAKVVRIRRCRLMKDWGLSKGRKYLADVVFTHKKADIAVLKIRHPPKLVPAWIGSSKKLPPEVALFRVGADDNPLGSGYLKSRSTEQGIPELTISMNADVGSSGGPIFDPAGRLVAIALRHVPFAKMPQMISYAIPIDAILTRIKRRRLVNDHMDQPEEKTPDE